MRRNQSDDVMFGGVVRHYQSAVAQRAPGAKSAVVDCCVLTCSPQLLHGVVDHVRIIHRGRRPVFRACVFGTGWWSVGLAKRWSDGEHDQLDIVRAVHRRSSTTHWLRRQTRSRLPLIAALRLAVVHPAHVLHIRYAVNSCVYRSTTLAGHSDGPWQTFAMHY